MSSARSLEVSELTEARTSKVVSSVKGFKDFVFDKNNELIIEQLFCYITNNSAFSGDLNKELCCKVNTVAPKLSLLETYSLLHNLISRRFSESASVYVYQVCGIAGTNC